MATFYRVVPLPDKWPAGEQLAQAKRPKSPFKNGWADSIKLLESEVRALSGRDVTLAIDVRLEDLNQQGAPRADARIKNSAVVLTFTAGKDRLTFPCDAFDWWQDNVRALALALGDLRRVDRYRVNRGRQYEGFKALPSGAGPARTAMAIEEAGMVISVAGDRAYSEWEILNVPARAQLAVRAAAAVTHPDRASGGTFAFQQVQDAKAALEAHLGVEL